MSFYIGLMSGTSMDGIDAALVRLPEHQLVYGITKKYSTELKDRVTRLINEINLSLASVCQLNTLIGREFAQAAHELVQDSRISSQEVVAIGSHGQTVCHQTSSNPPYTLQLGCAHTIASITGIDVVADFRTRDLVNGGQGAPFAPLYHQELFSRLNQSVAVINLGGIANITLISPGKATLGWDIGPGNCLMDAWMYKNRGLNYDQGGQWGGEGTVIPSLLNRLLSDPFFALRAPKSIGKEYFSLAWLDSYLSPEFVPVDVQATLLALTAHSIEQIVLSLSESVETIYLCGGGVHNLNLIKKLTGLLPNTRIQSTAKLGVDPDYLEAMMCAWLASQAINRISLDLRAITGSKHPSILGAIYLANEHRRE